jgi:protein TonB
MRRTPGRISLVSPLSSSCTFWSLGIVNGLGKRMVSKMAEAVETKIDRRSETAATAGTPPPPPPPEMKAPPPPFIPPVEVQVQQPPPPQNTIANATNTPPPTTSLAPPAPPAPAPCSQGPAGPSRTDAVADFNTCARPEYPKSSLRNEETGTTTLQFLIGVTVTGDGFQMQKSSGFRDLDRAAQTALSKCRFKPATENGQPKAGVDSGAVRLDAGINRGGTPSQSVIFVVY